MQNFAAQCLDMARSILGHNLDAINEDGTITPVGGEPSRFDESGHAALAIGEYYRASGQNALGTYDLVDLAARCITAQAFTEEENENGLAYASLGLLSFGPAKDRNAVWERLVDETRERLDKRLLVRSDYEDHLQVFNIAKSVARYSMGLSKKDETGKLVDRFIERIQENSSGGFVDDGPKAGVGGVFNIYGILSFVFIRQALQLHANIHLRDRKLPSLRTYAEKYIRLLPDIVRQDGLGFAFGRGIGAYGQMHCISILLQGMRDGWIRDEERALYQDILRRLFQFFFMTYLDQEHGFVVIRDEERTTGDVHTTRLANFDAARYLCQWARLAKSITAATEVKQAPGRTTGRYVMFDSGGRKEQGLFLYQDASSGLQIQLPLTGAGTPTPNCDALAFPHCPGVFDWPAGMYLPIMMPELTFGDKVTIPSYYGRRCVAGLGLRNSFYFRYEQPELVTVDEKFVNGIGSCKVQWTFTGNKVQAEFIYTVRSQIQLDRMRYVIVIGSPHSTYRLGTSFTLGGQGLRCTVLKDDFQAAWQETEVVTHEAPFKTYYGNLHYVQTLKRDHPLVMRPGQQYKLVVAFDPDLAFAGE